MKDSKPKTILRWIGRMTLCLYGLATLPLLILFLWNPTCQNTFLNLSSHYLSKIDPIRTVHIGDSITSGGGGHWSTIIGGYPLDAYNLAGNGYTVDQIKHQVPKALEYSPEWIGVMGGTNDIFDPRYDIDYTIASYNDLLAEIHAAKIQCVVTLVPYQAADSKRTQIDELNQRVSAIADNYRCQIIDLNPLLAPDGKLLPQYTTDGTHFTDAAYSVWGSQLKLAMRERAGEQSDARGAADNAVSDGKSSSAAR